MRGQSVNFVVTNAENAAVQHFQTLSVFEDVGRRLGLQLHPRVTAAACVSGFRVFHNDPFKARQDIAAERLQNVVLRRTKTNSLNVNDVGPIQLDQLVAPLNVSPFAPHDIEGCKARGLQFFVSQLVFLNRGSRVVPGIADSQFPVKDGQRRALQTRETRRVRERRQFTAGPRESVNRSVAVAIDRAPDAVNLGFDVTGINDLVPVQVRTQAKTIFRDLVHGVPTRQDLSIIGDSPNMSRKDCKC